VEGGSERVVWWGVPCVPHVKKKNMVGGVWVRWWHCGLCGGGGRALCDGCGRDAIIERSGDVACGWVCRTAAVSRVSLG
jgi:hypothetical protein